jgi:hypothetical protein
VLTIHSGKGAMKIDRCPLTRDEKKDLIEREAYDRYEKRGGTGGNSTDDWLKAEAEVEKQMNEVCRPKFRKPGSRVSRARASIVPRGKKR